MRFAHQALTLLTLLVFTSQMVGGHALHLWQCSTGGCCSSEERSVEKTSACGHHHCSSHAHSESESKTSLSEELKSSTDQPPEPPVPHDHSDCFVCQMLAHAGEASPATPAHEQTKATPLVAIEIEATYLSAPYTQARPRAPPTA